MRNITRRSALSLAAPRPDILPTGNLCGAWHTHVASAVFCCFLCIVVNFFACCAELFIVVYLWTTVFLFYITTKKKKLYTRITWIMCHAFSIMTWRGNNSWSHWYCWGLDCAQRAIICADYSKQFGKLEAEIGSNRRGVSPPTPLNSINVSLSTTILFKYPVSLLLISAYTVLFCL